jgi:uncharacterized spore protein YtfJ
MEPQVIHDGTGSLDGIASVVHDVAAILEQEGNVRVVFGSPVKLDTRTIIPVATVALGGGGGGIGRLGPTVDVLRRWFAKGVHVSPKTRIGGGGGWGIDVRPVGFLSEEEGRVVFTRIDDGKHAQGAGG